jgi:hypothetical protein
MPGLQNLTLTTNGVLDVDDLINIGASTTKAPGNPVTRKYIVNSITNLGSMASGGLIFQPKIFANGGSLVSSNNGAVQMNAKTNLLGAGLGLPNSIVADGDINFLRLHPGQQFHHHHRPGRQRPVEPLCHRPG